MLDEAIRYQRDRACGLSAHERAPGMLRAEHPDVAYEVAILTRAAEERGVNGAHIAQALVDSGYDAVLSELMAEPHPAPDAEPMTP